MNKIEVIFDIYGNINEINYYESIDSTEYFSFNFNKSNSVEIYNVLCKYCTDNKKTDLGGYYEHDFYDIDDNIIKAMLLTEDNLEELGDYLSIVEDDEELRNKYNKIINSRKLKEYKQQESIINSNKSRIIEDDYRKIKRKKRGKLKAISIGIVLLAALIVFSSAHSRKKGKTKETINDEITTYDYNVSDDKKNSESLIIDNEVNTSNEETKDFEIDKSNNDNFSDVVVENNDSSKPTHDTLFLKTENMIGSLKYQIAYTKYYEDIAKYANMYGIDPSLALAICTHERGIHSSSVDSGGAIGLFQIQVEGNYVWESVTAYNYETQSWETVSVTEESVSDVTENIKVGCMIIQNSLRENNYDIPKSIQAYNYGTNNMQKVLDECVKNEKLSRDELNDPYNLIWLKYRSIIKNGDPNYLENVFKYIEDGSTLKFMTPDGETISFIYDNINCDDYVYHV